MAISRINIATPAQQSVIKSVQRGTSVVVTNSTVNVTVTSVNMSKAHLTFPTNTMLGAGYSVYASLSSATNIAIHNSDVTNSPTVSWELVEYV